MRYDGKLLSNMMTDFYGKEKRVDKQVKQANEPVGQSKASLKCEQC